MVPAVRLFCRIPPAVSLVERERDRQTERQRDRERQTDRQRQRERGIQTERYSQTERQRQREGNRLTDRQTTARQTDKNDMHLVMSV